MPVGYLYLINLSYGSFIIVLFIDMNGSSLSLAHKCKTSSARLVIFPIFWLVFVGARTSEKKTLQLSQAEDVYI